MIKVWLWRIRERLTSKLVQCFAASFMHMIGKMGQVTSEGYVIQLWLGEDKQAVHVFVCARLLQQTLFSYCAHTGLG